MEQVKPQFCRLCYGYTKSADKQIVAEERQAGVVQMIYREYVKDTSLAALVEFLAEQNVPSPTGKD